MLNAKKLLSLFLLLSMLLSLFAACTPADKEPEDSETESTPVNEDVKLVEADASKFQVVYPFDYDNLTFVAKDYAGQIVSAIKELTGVTLQLKDDYVPKNETHNSETLEILVGITAYDETKELLETVGYGDYAIGFVGNKLVITAATTTALSAATTRAIELFTAGYSATDNSVTLKSDLNETATVVPMLNKLPRYTGADSFSLTDAGDGSYVLAVGDVTLEEHNSYLDLIKAAYTLKEEHNILNDTNRYALYTDGTDAVTTIHTSYNNAARVIIEPIAANGYYTYENKSGAGSYAPLLIQVGLNPPGSGSPQNGMCYVVRLSNGRFMIWDGGHDDSVYKVGQNCQRLVNVLKGYAPNPNNVRIACWLITHPHTDHIGALQYFCNNLSKFSGVTVDNLLVNLPSDVQAMQDTSSDGLEVKMNKYREVIKKLTDKGTVLHKSHPGQVYQFADAKLEILYSHDMRAEKPLKESNNLSIVSKLTIAGQTILFNGDTHTRSNEVMIGMYGKDLKVDFYQAPHHGFGPNDVEYPKLADPTYTLLPIGPDQADDVRKNAWMAHVLTNSTVYTAKFKTMVFVLPFDGSETNFRETANGTIY